MSYMNRAERAASAALAASVARPVTVTVRGHDGAASTARGVLLRVGGPLAYVSVRNPVGGRVGTIKAHVSDVVPAPSEPVSW